MKAFLIVIAAFSSLTAIAANTGELMPQVELGVQVIDENSKPILGAEVQASFPHLYAPGSSYQGEEKRGTTDANGRIFWKAFAAGDVGFAVTKTGYYRTQGKSTDFMQMVREGKEPKVERVALLKKVVLPVPMYARWFEVSLPAMNKPCGFDLMEGDWVAPWGHGKTADLIFTLTGSYGKYNDYDAALEITFPNKGDGLVPFEGAAQTGSELRSAHQAPVDGYEEKLTLNKSRKPDQNSSQWIDESANGANYYLRTRTVLDDKGKVVSAQYGKVYGNFQFGAAENQPVVIKAEAYYVNPSVNDRNVEFDLKRNLAPLRESDRVNLP